MPRFLPIAILAFASAAALAPLAAAPAAPAGAALFRQRCQSCHALAPGAPSPIGPNLAGVVGRKAGATSFRYSPALKAANLTWTRENLDRFLTAPTRMVPGTRMVISVTDAGQRDELVKFLESAR